MKKTLFICVALFVCFSNCKKESIDECGGNDPVKNLEWLKKTVESASGSCTTVLRSKLDNKTVFIVAICQCCFAAGPQTLYNCDGSLYCPDVNSQACTDAIIQARNKAEIVFQQR